MNDQQTQEQHQEQKPKSNKVMFYIGVTLILVAAILLFTENSTYPIALGVIGIVFIGASRYRLLKNRK